MTEGQTGPKFGGGKEWQKAGDEYTNPSYPSVDRKRYRNSICFEILNFGFRKQTFEGFTLVMYNDIILFHLRDHINCDLTLFKKLFDQREIS